MYAAHETRAEQNQRLQRTRELARHNGKTPAPWTSHGSARPLPGTKAFFEARAIAKVRRSRPVSAQDQTDECVGRLAKSLREFKKAYTELDPDALRVRAAFLKMEVHQARVGLLAQQGSPWKTGRVEM
jgi:hypothetical protein